MERYPQLLIKLRMAFLGVQRLVERAPLNDKQLDELEDYVKTFWSLAVQICELPDRQQFQA
jgi:hypothetical protein